MCKVVRWITPRTEQLWIQTRKWLNEGLKMTHENIMARSLTPSNHGHNPMDPRHCRPAAPTGNIIMSIQPYGPRRKVYLQQADGNEERAKNQGGNSHLWFAFSAIPVGQLFPDD
jgi:hypothetical protein